MKLGEGNKPRGSFGIPDDMAEAARRAQARKEQPKAESSPAKEAQPAEEPTPPVEEQPSINKKLNPIETLRTLGIEFTEDDLQNLVLYARYEAEVDVIKGHLKASVKMLNTKEYDEIDELLGEEIDENRNITMEALNNRRSMWILAYGVTKLNGKALAKPVNGDSKATARAKRDVLRALSSVVINKLSRIHGTIHTAITLIGEDPELLKNS